MISDRIASLSLNDKEVEERINKGLSNKMPDTKTKSIKKIVFENVVTLFNILNLFLMTLLLLVGSFKNMLFMGVVVCNTIIGIVQEIRSKKAVDRLSIVIASDIEAVRNGKLVSIPAEEIVVDDIIALGAGIQIPCDCEVAEGFCYANESLLTGESDQVEKNVGDKLFSGSYVSAGKVFAKVIHTGKDNYSSKIETEASYSKKINSEIMNTLNKVITFCSIAIFPMGIAMFINQYFFNHETIHDSVISIVAALIGMIPEGLILLTSTVLAVAVIRLSRKKVLVQQLFCIETLARVDVLCLDKTGTITTGELEVVDIESFDSEIETDVILKSLAKCSLDKNETIKAINSYLKCSYLKEKDVIPFSSDKKWSGAVLSDGNSYVLGAAEIIIDKKYKEVFDTIEGIDDDYRVVTLAVSSLPFKDKQTLPENLKPIALVVIRDKIRENASKTIDYFKKQGVILKVISGDNNKTVERIADSVGVPDAHKSIDASTLKTDDEIDKAVENYAVFGRVTPQQKKSFVEKLKAHGHTVAMTGDGVNDILALKEADCSVAMASGSDAAKNTAQLVLADNDFAHMPEVVAEGRRSINNIQRSASLFIVKTIYSFILAFVFIFVNVNYPFQPLQISLTSAFTIGLPSFVLALQPNHNRIQGRFMKNVILRSYPGSIMVVANIIVLICFSGQLSFPEFSTLSVILTALIGVNMVIRLSIPINALRAALIVVVIAGLSVGILCFTELFNFVLPTGFALNLLIILAIISIVVYNVIYTLSTRLLIKK